MNLKIIAYCLCAVCTSLNFLNGGEVRKILIKNDIEDLKKYLTTHTFSKEDSNAVYFAETLDAILLLQKHGFPIKGINKTGMNLLMIGVQNGQYDVVSHFLDIGMPIMHKDFHGQTALHFSSGNLDLKITKLLLEKGAYIDAQNNKGVTPLMQSILNEDLLVFKLLLQSGANVDLKDCNGMKAIDYLNEPLDYLNKNIIADMKNVYRNTLFK
tara:strand:- start:279 stop:914 length:636 start_codon:yes stop_codon:yes gene_type:complete